MSVELLIAAGKEAQEAFLEMLRAVVRSGCVPEHWQTLVYHPNPAQTYESSVAVGNPTLVGLVAGAVPVCGVGFSGVVPRRPD